MNESTLTCKDDRRRQAIHQQERLNGLDYLEVSDDQRSLFVYFLGSVPTNITKNNIRIEGGRRIRDIQVISVEVQSPADRTLDGYLKVVVDRSGDFSTYTFNLVAVDDRNRPIPLAGFDLRYARLQFNFKVGCPNDLDCQSALTCPPEERIEPEINYLAKDYASFRQLILDRLALTIPAWKERHIPDLGITLVELLAYVGDYLSYYQDAVGTEAYLDIARQRISVRRHVRLVDYVMHEGCNSRTWVWIEIETDSIQKISPSEIFFITSYPGAPNKGTILNREEDLRNVPFDRYEVFEPITTKEIELNPAHNEIHFYTWGDRQCCLPKGSTQATLSERWQNLPVQSEDDDGSEDPNLSATAQPQPKLSLTPGDILIFEEVKGAKTGNQADADPSHRHAVRLTNVKIATDALYLDPIHNSPTPIVEIEWAHEDALPFSLCISALGAAPGCCLIENISVARGNVILVDRGRTIDPEDLKTVVGKDSIALCEGQGKPTESVTVPKPFRPKLKYAPLTFSQPLSPQDLAEIPASKLLAQDPRQALPQITKLIGFPPVENNQFPPEREEWKWIPTSDLLSSYSQDPHFVVEMDDEGSAHLRFGDGELGKQPKIATQFFATYRVGNGTVGNIGADAIAHIVYRHERLSGVKLTPHNPFPAKGGTEPETLAEVKLFAPTAFRKKLQRAITSQDYADIVMRDFPTQVQRAAATLRWTGSWYELLVAIDPRNTDVASPQLLAEIDRHLYLYRRIGHDLMVKSAVYVPLAIAMHICVLPDYLRGHVKAALMDAFSNRRLANGQLGFFHPDNLTFGTGIYLSQLVAAAQAIPGVMSVKVTRLKRLASVANPASIPTVADAASVEILNGVLPLGGLEIARLDNDPSFPEHGVLKFEIGGGR